MKGELDLWYELWDKAGSQGLDTWYELRNEGRYRLGAGAPDVEGSDEDRPHGPTGARYADDVRRTRIPGTSGRFPTCSRPARLP